MSTASAIPRASTVVGPDRPHIRIRCASGGPPCVVFVECGDREQDADYFCAELEAIEDKETVHLSRNDLAKANGPDVDDGAEELSCHVLSNDPVKV